MMCDLQMSASIFHETPVTAVGVDKAGTGRTVQSVGTAEMAYLRNTALFVVFKIRELQHKITLTLEGQLGARSCYALSYLFY